MMLTAIPANPSSSLFTPPIAASSSASQPGSPNSGPPQAQSSAHILRGMDSKATPGGGGGGGSDVGASNQGQSPAHIIPLSAIHQPFLLGTGAGGYTLVPSIQQMGTASDAHLLGIQPLSAVSALPRGSTTVQPLAAIPSGYYGRVQSDAAPPVGFQQPIQQPPPPALSSGNPGSAPSETIAPPHHLLLSGTGAGVIMNGSSGSNLETKPVVGLEQTEQGVIVGAKKSVLSPPSSSSPPSQLHLHQKNVLDKSNSSSDPDVFRRTSSGGDSRRRASHDAHLTYSRSRAARHANRSSVSSPPPPSSSNSDIRLPPDILVKREPPSTVGDDPPLHRHARRNSDSTLEETGGGAPSSSKSYQISALIDIPPMAPPLNRASRTSSLSSSLSSFRFGGSLSQLWASQISLSGKINNMKSTG